MEAWEYWRNLEEVNIIQGALMAANIDPTSLHNSVERLSDHKKPPTYEPMKFIILSAISAGKLNAKLSYYRDENFGNDELSIYSSMIAHDDLAAYLKLKRIDSVFFNFDDKNEQDPYNKNSPFYSPKLAAANEAWKAVTSEKHRLNKCTPKQALEKWLEENASRFGLINKDGSLNKNGIEEVAKIANWKTKGGAPQLTAIYAEPAKESFKTNTQQTPTSFDELDSEIPF